MLDQKDIFGFSKKVLRSFLKADVKSSRFFFCGGAFKTLINSNLPVNDVDIWVENQDERKKFVSALTKIGAIPIGNFHPYCLRFKLKEQFVEITYHNISQSDVKGIVNQFDLALCAVGVEYENGKFCSEYVGEDARRSIRDRTVYLMKNHPSWLLKHRGDTIIRTVDRLKKTAQVMGYKTRSIDYSQLWEIYREYSYEQKMNAIQTYLDTMIPIKGCIDKDVLSRAMTIV